MLPDRLFARLPARTRPGDIVTLPTTPGRWRVETAHLAEDMRDSKCVVVRVADEDALPPAA